MADTQTTDGAAGGSPPSRRRPLLLLWAILAALVVGAGAIVVAAGDDDPPRLPIALGAGAGDGRAEADTAMAADTALSRMAWIRYVAGGDLPALGGDAPASRLSNVVDRSRLQAVADALGLDGELVEQPDSRGSWQLEAADGSRLGAGPYGGGGWWYTSGALLRQAGGGTSSSAGVDLEAREREAAAQDTAVSSCAPDAVCSEPLPGPIPEPEPFVPPADLPTEDEAEAIALDLFERLGVDVEGAQVTTEGPMDAWYVSIEPRVDGVVVSGYVFNAAVGPKGEITTAGGVLNRPEGLGDYPTVDTRAAIDRLNEQSGFGDGREPAGQDLATTDVDCAAATEARAATDPSPKVADDPVCAPSDPAEPTEVVLEDAERILVLVERFDAEEPESYLVPGYRFRHGGEGWVDVIAVDDESLLPQPPAPDPLPVDPLPVDPGDGGGVDGGPGCAPVEPGPDGAVPDICVAPESVEPSGPVSDPDAPVSSPVGER